MSTSQPAPLERRSHPTVSAADPPALRWRLWAAMLALALVPTLAGIYLTTSLLQGPDPKPALERTRAASEAAASLVARQQAIEARLLMAAADPNLARLTNGIDGTSDQRLAERLLAGLRGNDGGIISGACIARTIDGRLTTLGDAAASPVQACPDAALMGVAADAGSGIVAHARRSEHGERLLMAAPLAGASGRQSGVLSIEVDVPALFDRVLPASAVTHASMLVDMGSSEVIALAADAGGPVVGADAAPSAIAPLLAGIVSGREAADEELAAMGLAPTVVPLWDNGDGTRTGLVQLWTDGSDPIPLEIRVALVIMLAGAIVAVIVLVRYFLNPFQEMADSRAELQELYREARQDALADGLTGLGNHRAFQEALGRQIATFEERGTPFSLALLDLDDLKVVNDRDGHAAGDSMLRSVAQTMRELARRDDQLYRTGGDEFAVILPNTTIDDAITVAERILHFCKRPADGGRPFSFSGGISGVPWFARKRDTVYRQADAALYWAKRHGRGSVEVFDPERDQLPDEVTDATAFAVQEIITGKLLRPVFQPIVDLRSGRVLGFEGLIRPDPDGPLPDTGRLFAAAAASGRTVELDLACIEAVVKGARAIGPDRLLTLNLSPRTLEVKDFDAAWLLKGLVQNGISPSRVIIELTEREEIDDLPRLRKAFTSLQQYGLRLAADDVGAGNSGLRLLSQVQFDIVKIDLSLVHDGVRRMGSRAVLQSLRDLALSQDARIVAEGVETAVQLQVIRELQIGAGQGFLLGMPNASVETTFVDLHGLETGAILAQPVGPPGFAPVPRPPAGAATEEELTPERRAIFLPPATRRVLEPGAGAA